MLRILPLCLVALVCAACQPRMPLTRTEASSAARNWCVRDGLAWGDPVEVSPPTEADSEGRRWWKVRFAGDGHVALVNADSGWVKQAP